MQHLTLLVIFQEKQQTLLLMMIVTGDPNGFQPQYVVPAGERASMDFNIEFVLPKHFLQML